MLKFNYGVMRSGKSAQMINAYEIYRRKRLDPILIKPRMDTRECDADGWGWASSRLIPDKKIPCYFYNDLGKELDKLSYCTIIVDEAQFMKREDVLLLKEISQKTTVLAYGLKTDVNGNLFEGSSALLALADEVHEIPTLCEARNCTNKAELHARYIDGKRDYNGDSVAIEKGNVTYKALCWKHWREL